MDRRYLDFPLCMAQAISLQPKLHCSSKAVWFLFTISHLLMSEMRLQPSVKVLPFCTALECTSHAAASRGSEIQCWHQHFEADSPRALAAVFLNENKLFVSFIASVIASSNLFLLSKCPCFMKTVSKQLCSLFVPLGFSLGVQKESQAEKFYSCRMSFLCFRQT